MNHQPLPGTGAPLKTTSRAARVTQQDDIIELAAAAYVYGYPLVIMDVTREVMTAVPRAQGSKAPINQILHLRAFPDPAFTDVVTPNADTLYSFAWLDLKREPQILSIPEMGQRYCLMQMLDAWTNVFASPGTRTTGNGKADFAVVGPGWKGTLPAGVKEIRSPTDIVWMIGRIQTNGASDYAAVHAIQDQYRLTPLSACYKPYTLPMDVPVPRCIDDKTPPVSQVAAMSAATFFGRLNALMKGNPPAAADAAALARFARIGIAPGKPFDLNGMNPLVAKALERGVDAGQLEIAGEAKKAHGRQVNGWDVLPANTANFGTDYTWRAVVALVGLGANLPADAVYPHAVADAGGRPLDGAHRYQIRFAKEQLPPVNGFWSLTMYNAKQRFVENSIDRYAIGDRDPLVPDADGSVTIHVQADSPGAGKESNWLPAPPESFNVFMRLYWPQQAVIDGTWSAPPIERVG